VLDTHAGIGRYDLNSRMALKNAEFRDGIAMVWGRKDVPDEFISYFDAIRGGTNWGSCASIPVHRASSAGCCGRSTACPCRTQPEGLRKPDPCSAAIARRPCI